MKQTWPFTFLGSGLVSLLLAIANWQLGLHRTAIVWFIWAVTALLIFLLATGHSSLATLWASLRRSYRHRFHGFTEAPRLPGSRGTDWQEHLFQPILFVINGVTTWPNKIVFICRCGAEIGFTSEDYFIREREHIEGCGGIAVNELQHFDTRHMVSDSYTTGRCSCPVTDARYIKVCAHCGLGHWMDASPRKVASG